MNAYKKSYYNTLIFTIIAGVVSVALLCILILKKGQEYMPFIVTLEIGIFSIIALCITMILVNEFRQSKKMDKASANVSFSTCPDYFVKRTLKDKELCSNEYLMKAEDGRQYLIKIYPEDSGTNVNAQYSLPQTHSTNYNQDPKYEKFYLNEIDSVTDIKSAADKCSILFNPPRDPKLANLRGYHLPPWTTMRAKCDSLVN
jgi:hypothetical protein